MITFGMYVNEVVKRADPKRSLWVIFDEDIAKKFGACSILDMLSRYFVTFLFQNSFVERHVFTHDICTHTFQKQNMLFYQT